MLASVASLGRVPLLPRLLRSREWNPGLVDRQDKNGQLFDLSFANPDFQDMMLEYLGRAYDEFRRQMAV